MKLAIMQPYFFPYIGYFQLMHAVDKFVVYDNIKYTKKGWINRNRILLNNADTYVSLPLKSDSDSLQIRERTLASEFHRIKLLNQFKGAYHNAPFFESTYPVIERIVQHSGNNLFEYIFNSIVSVAKHLALPTEFIVSSSLPIDHSLKSQDKVIAICEKIGASTYINAIGGMELYSPGDFNTKGIDLKFIQPLSFDYRQFNGAFVPWLSIIDVLMFNAEERIQEQLRSGYSLIERH